MADVPRGWVVGATGVAYPPEPWHLGGTLLSSTFLVDEGRLPDALRAALPPHVRPVRFRGRAVVGVGVARYEPGGVLAYDEFLVARLVIGRRGPAVSIGQIWVDHPASVAGARELWCIPKEPATFERRVDRRNHTVAMTLDGAEVVRLDAHLRRGIPGGHLPIPTAQRLDGRVAFAWNTLAGTLGGLHATWTFAPDGPVGYLAVARPIASLALTRASIVFGRRVRRS